MEEKANNTINFIKVAKEYFWLATTLGMIGTFIATSAVNNYKSGESKKAVIDTLAKQSVQYSAILKWMQAIDGKIKSITDESTIIGSSFCLVYITRALAVHNINSVYFSGIAYVKIEGLTTEFYVPGKWYDSVYTVLDTGNYGHGEIHYECTEFNVGYNDAKFIKSTGCGYLQCSPVAFASNTSFTVTGARDESEGALKDLIAKLVAKGIIVDSTTAS